MKNLAIELRPTCLSEVLGMPDTIAAIQKQLASERIPNVWLFEGEPGTGKTSLSYILAREVQGIDYKGDIDLEEINCGDKNGVDSVRNLLPSLKYNPFSGKYRIRILNEAQRLTDEAQQVLLVPTEDPTSTTIFFLTTTDSSKIIDALKSRCGAAKYKLKGLDKQGRYDLIYRAAVATKVDKAFKPVTDLIEEYGITSGRDIINMVEGYANGLPLVDLIPMGESDPVYQEIAKAAIKGQWNQLVPLLKKLKPSDAKPLRSVLSGWFRNALLTGSQNCGTIAKEFALYQAYEAGIDLTALVAILWSYCQKQSGKQ